MCLCLSMCILINISMKTLKVKGKSGRGVFAFSTLWWSLLSWGLSCLVFYRLSHQRSPPFVLPCHTSSMALCWRHRRTVHHEPSNSPSSFLFIFSKSIYFGPHDLRDPSSPTRGWTHSLGQWKLRVLTTEPPGNSQLSRRHDSHHPSLVFVVSLCSF